MITFGETRRCLGSDPESARVWDKYQSWLLADSLRLDPDCRWCPRPGCGTPMIGDRSRPMMICPKSGCHFSFCFNCKEEWHADTTCERYQQWKIDNGGGDAKFDEWAAQNTKVCPNCRAHTEKNGGCNHMTCQACKHNWCWLCNGPYKSGACLSVHALIEEWQIEKFIVCLKCASFSWLYICVCSYLSGHYALDESSPCHGKQFS
jgi:hypothetical protein